MSKLQNISWKIILGYFFLRPFVSSATFGYFEFSLNIILLISALLYFHKKRIPYTLIDKVIGIFYITMIITTLVNKNTLIGLHQVHQLLILMVLFYIGKTLNKQQQKQLFFALILGATILFCCSLRYYFIVSQYALEYLSKNNIHYPFAEEFILRKRAFAPFITPSILAGYTSIILLLSTGITIQHVRENRKNLSLFFSILCFVLGLTTLFLTRSIGAYILFVISLAIMLIATKTLPKKIFIVILVLLPLFSVIANVRTINTRRFTNPSFSFERRLVYWEKTWDIICQNPIFGVGRNNLSLPEARSTHNSYLQIWAENGIIGILSWLLIVLLFIKKGLKNARSPAKSYIKAGCFAGGIFFLTHNIINFDFFVSQEAFLWWVLLGMNEN